MSYFAPLRTTALSLAIVLAGGFAASAHAADVTGAGASFVYPIMSKWSADYAADHRGELGQAELREFLRLERRIRRTEVDGAGLDLRDAAARTDRLVVDLLLRLSLIHI